MTATGLEPQLGEWRAFLVARRMEAGEVEELETHLRDQIAELRAAGLGDDEAFLIAVKRLGALDALSNEFARENHARLWKQLVLSDDDGDGAGKWEANGLWAAAGLALAAAVAVQILRLVVEASDPEPEWWARNLAFFVLPFLAAFLGLRRGLTGRQWLITAALFASPAVLINLFPYGPDSSTEFLVALHLPVALWFAVGYPYTVGEVGSHEQRMDYIRFTGEWLIYYALIMLGGAVLSVLALFILEPVGIDEALWVWLVPSGAAAGVIVAAWLVEAKQRVIENMAPVLTMIFTPLFAVLLVMAAVAYAISVPDGFDRDLLTILDVLLVVVVGLVVYEQSARDPARPPRLMDGIQFAAVAAALILDAIVLGTMLTRIGEFGFSPNRAAALGLNLVLLVNLAGAAWLSLKFIARRTGFAALERWQTSYLPVFAFWVVAVVLVFPPVFGFE